MCDGAAFLRERSGTVVADPLSDIISVLAPRDCVAGGLDAGGDWSVRFERHAGLKCNAVLRGRCWLDVDGAEPVALAAGDCAVLPKGLPFRLSARPERRGERADTPYVPVPHGGTATYGGGGDFFMAGARFLLSGAAADLLLGALPPVLVVRAGPEQAALQWSLERIAHELREPAPGGTVSIGHLSHFVLVQVMRHHLGATSHERGGWLAALADPHVSRAVAAMHEDPARRWSVAQLALQAGLSRTAFAVRFRRLTGQTPIDYLTRWRMLLATERLRRTGEPIARVAADVGYASESAFAVAFKRATGRPPRRYLRELEGADGARAERRG